jgi:hypothetical protein
MRLQMAIAEQAVVSHGLASSPQGKRRTERYALKHVTQVAHEVSGAGGGVEAAGSRAGAVLPRDGMLVGLGTGSTAAKFVDLVGER